MTPAERIGYLLGVDDGAGEQIWNNARAGNPNITPRVCVLVAKLKRESWRRVDDRMRGKALSNPTGMLIRSMRAAVRGVFFDVASGQAADELTRDRAEARAILAGNASPRERSWALAVLTE